MSFGCPDLAHANKNTPVAARRAVLDDSASGFPSASRSPSDLCSTGSTESTRHSEQTAASPASCKPLATLFSAASQSSFKQPRWSDADWLMGRWVDSLLLEALLHFLVQFHWDWWDMCGLLPSSIQFKTWRHRYCYPVHLKRKHFARLLQVTSHKPHVQLDQIYVDTFG